jgi:hypothetical protein
MIIFLRTTRAFEILSESVRGGSGGEECEGMKGAKSVRSVSLDSF